MAVAATWVRRASGRAGDLRIQLFASLFGLGTIHHELQFILEQQRGGPFSDYMERWGQVKPSVAWPSDVGIFLHLADLVLGLLLLALPWRRALLNALAVVFPLATLVSPHRIPSHNSLMVAALALLLTFGLAESVERAVQPVRRCKLPTDWHRWTLAGLTSLCSLTYLFAAFHKLNATYVSLADSTAPPFILSFAEPLGMPRDAALPLLGYPAIYGTLAIELSLPVLLMRRRSRLAGCLLGGLFHLAMMARGIMDFPTIILGFYPLFMTVDEVRELRDRCLSRPSPPRLAATAAIWAAGAAAFARSPYVQELYLNSGAQEPVVMWAHGAFSYATLLMFAYVTSTLAASLLGRVRAGRSRSPGGRDADDSDLPPGDPPARSTSPSPARHAGCDVAGSRPSR